MGLSKTAILIEIILQSLNEMEEPVPTGPMYAALMGVCSFEQFVGTMNGLTDSQCIRRTDLPHHVEITDEGRRVLAEIQKALGPLPEAC